MFVRRFRELLNHQKLAGHPHIIEIQEVFLTRCDCSIAGNRTPMFVVTRTGAGCQTSISHADRLCGWTIHGASRQYPVPLG